jgi:hypothetical protein
MQLVWHATRRSLSQCAVQRVHMSVQACLLTHGRVRSGYAYACMAACACVEKGSNVPVGTRALLSILNNDKGADV